MNSKRKNIYRYLYAAAAGFILLALSLMPFSAVKVHAEQERIYQSISDTLRFGETFIYKDGYLTTSEKRGSVDWMLEAMCLEPWDLKLVQANNTPDEQSFYRVKDERVYRGYLSEGDRLRSSATINGINGYISTHARVYFDNGSDFEFRLSSENDFELMDATDGDRVDSTATKSWTVYNDYTVEQGVKKVVIFIYHEGDLRGRTVTTDDAYLNIRFEFTVNKASQSVTEKADDKPGEDHGTYIKPEIINEPDDSGFPGGVIVSIGGAAAAGAAIVSGSGDKKTEGKDDKKKKKRSSYRMYVYKEFGDAIRKDGQPVRIGARIAEITEDGEVERNDLSEKIRIFSEDDTLSVSNPRMSGKYKFARVSCEKDSPHAEGTVSFQYEGEGGIFTKHVVFRLVGAMEIVFPAMNADGNWVANANLNETDVIAGIGGRARLRFMIKDATEEPKRVTFANTGGFDIGISRDKEYAYTYWAEITNKTDKIEKTAGIFADKKQQAIGIKAIFEDKSSVESEFLINIWPDGISVPMEDQKDGYIEMDTLPDEKAAGTANIPPARFNVYVCYLDGEEAVIEKNPTMTFSGFFDEGKYGKTFTTEHFPWKVFGGAGIAIYPYKTLPVIMEPYYAYLKLLYRGTGQREEAELPFRLTGIKADLPSMARKEEALRKLKRAIQIFGIGSDPDLRNMVRNAPHMSGADIEHLTNQILLAGREFYQAQSEEYASIDAVMTKYIVVASSLVAIGDKATEMAIKQYWPTAPADLIAAFANPFKNALAEYLGQYVARWSWVDLTEGGDIEEFAFMKTLVSSSNQTLEAVLTGETPMTPKVMGQIVSLYLMMSYARHYFYGEGDEKGDIFKSLLAAMGDLTLAKFKQFLGDKVKALGEKVLKPFSNYAGKLLSDQLRKGYQSKANTAGTNVFLQYVRGSYRDFGKLTNDAHKAAEAAREAMKSQYMEGAEKAIEETVEQAASAADIAIAQLLNYLFDGTLDENDSLGVETHEVATNYIIDRSSRTAQMLARGFKKCFGIDVEKAYKDAKETLDISIKLDGEYLIIAMFGYGITVNYVQNFESLFSLVYDTLFELLEDLWKARENHVPSSDPRDELTEDTSRLERQAENLKKLENSVNINYYW